MKATSEGDFAQWLAAGEHELRVLTPYRYTLAHCERERAELERVDQPVQILSTTAVFDVRIDGQLRELLDANTFAAAEWQTLS